MNTRLPVDAAERSRKALEQLVAWANGEHICARCDGEGELYRPASRVRGEFYCADDDFLECPDCDGRGEVL